MPGGWERYTNEMHGRGYRGPRWIARVMQIASVVIAIAGLAGFVVIPGDAGALLGLVVFFAGFILLAWAL